jgi:hypothetical protein
MKIKVLQRIDNSMVGYSVDIPQNATTSCYYTQVVNREEWRIANDKSYSIIDTHVILIMSSKRDKRYKFSAFDCSKEEEELCQGILPSTFRELVRKGIIKIILEEKK